MVTNLITSTPTYCEGATAVKTHIDSLTLSVSDDFVKVVPVTGREKLFLVFKIEKT